MKVKAEPMPMGKDGYFVEYEDGSSSWVSAETFEKVYKIAETPLDRMQIEFDELGERYRKSSDFIDSPKFSTLDDNAKILLAAQNKIQREYLFLLTSRMAAMSIGRAVAVLVDLGTAIKFLTAGGAISRNSWNERRRKDGMPKFVVKQIPAHITEDVIPNMQSLPQIAKDILMARKEPHIDYTNQMLIIDSEGQADSWLPSAEDIFANDWILVTNIRS